SLLVLAFASLAHAQATEPDAELVVAMPDDTTNMDPRIGMGSIRSTYIRQVFESLVDVDPQGKPVPGLALAWKPVSDTAWEFMLRKGVKFHDGEPFNADTVLFNLDRMFRRNLDKHGIKGRGGRHAVRQDAAVREPVGEGGRLHGARAHQRARAHAVGRAGARAARAESVDDQARRGRAQRAPGGHGRVEARRVEAQDVDAAGAQRD